MKIVKIILLTLLISIILIIGYILYYYLWPVNVEIFSIKSYSTKDYFENKEWWHPIVDKENEIFWEKEFGVGIDDIDYSKNFYYISKGRKIVSIKYQRIQRHLWMYPFAEKGIISFDDKFYPNKLFVCKTDTILCLYEP